MLPKLLQEWLETASAQLRCRRAVPGVRQELESHVAEQYNALRAAGRDEETAARETVQSMGDAVQVGVSLDAVHRPRAAWGPVLALGAVLLLSRLLWVWGGRAPQTVLGILPALLALAATAYWGDISRLARHGTALYLGYSLFLSLLPFFPGTRMVSGRVQYAEALCMLLVPLYALAVYTWKGRGLLGLLACAALLLPGLWACLMMPLLAGCLELVLAALALGIYCCAKDWFGWGRRKSFAVLTGTIFLLAAAFVLLLWSLGYMNSSNYWNRLLIYFQPQRDPERMGYFSLQLRDMWRGGDGFGCTPEQLASLLADFPLAYWFFRFGRGPMLLALGMVLAALAALGMAACQIKNAAGRLLALSCAVLFPVQLLVNLLAGSGLLVFRLSLPFLGGASTCCAQAVIAGLLLSAFRYDPVTAEHPVPDEGKKRLHLSVEWR